MLKLKTKGGSLFGSITYRREEPRLPCLPSPLRDPFAATLAAEAATWPLMLASFHQVSFIAPVANALGLLLLPAVMVIGGSGAILAAIWQTAGWPLLQLAGLIIT